VEWIKYERRNIK